MLGSLTAQVVIRRLPPNLPEEVLMKVLAPFLDNVDFSYFTTGDPSLEKNSFSRCYLNFKDRESMKDFSKRFDGHRFRNAQGKS